MKIQRPQISAACEICGDVSYVPVSDHCHAHDQVRGVICTSCNNLMGRVDRGFAPRSRRVELDLLISYRARCSACPPISATDLDHSIQNRPAYPPARHKPGTTKVLYVNLPSDLLRHVKAYARRRELNPASAIRMLIKQELDKDGKS